MEAKSILVLEDDPSAQRLIDYYLQREGFETHLCLNGVEGLAALEEQSFDAIVSDLMMPEMDGLEFRRRLLEDSRFSQIPFILLTARAKLSEVKNQEDLALGTVIAKPYVPDSLFEALDALISG